MNRLLMLAVVLYSGSAFADDCQFVAGTWRIDRFDQELQAQTETEIIFSDDGAVRADRRVTDGSETRYYEDWARWTCDNGVITIDWVEQLYGLEKGVVYLELQEINNSFFAFKEIREGDSGPVGTEVSQATRVRESSYIPCC